MNELWIAHYSICSWNSAKTWDDYLRAIELVLDDRLLKLDENDPVRRKADTSRSEGAYIVEFGEMEESRWLHGRFEKSKIEMEIQFNKNFRDSFGRAWRNRVMFYVPGKFASGVGIRRLIELFRLGNEALGAFYAYADLKEVICAKKPSTPSLNISLELMGVFWLTYFGSDYCAFFGRDTLSGLAETGEGPNNGMTLQLADFPLHVALTRRDAIEHELGALSFAGYGRDKEPGQYAIALEDLKRAQDY